MGLLNIFKKVVSKSVDGDTTTPEIRKTHVPLGLHQGSIVTLPEVELALASANGSIINAPEGNSIISSVREYTLFNCKIFECGFKDSLDFIQIIENGGNTVETTYWQVYDEVHPTSTEDWGIWLGTRDTTSQWGATNEQRVTGLIGSQQFQIDGPPPILYHRLWKSVIDHDILADRWDVAWDNGINRGYYSCEGMEYFRILDDGSSNEKLRLVVISGGFEVARVQICVGIIIPPESIGVIVGSV
jgi:hypothetical protein